MGVGVQRGLDGKCSGDGTGVLLGVLTGDGHGVSFGTRSGIDGHSGDQLGIGVSSLGTLFSPLSKGEISGSSEITQWILSVKFDGISDHLLASLSLFSCSMFSYFCSLSHCRTMCCRVNPTYSIETPFASGHLL